MRKIRKRNGLKWAIAVLMIALAAVVAMIVFKQREYDASEEFYDSLRGGAYCGETAV